MSFLSPKLRYNVMEELREDLIKQLVKHFIENLNACAVPLENEDEALYFVETLLLYLKGVYNSYPENEFMESTLFDEEEFLHEHLYMRFRKKMQPFETRSLRLYFSKDEQEQTQLFKILNMEAEPFTYAEYTDYISRVFVILRSVRKRITLHPQDRNIANLEVALTLDASDKELEQTALKSKSKEYTRSRQMLLFYFLGKLAGISKSDTSARSLAQFAHVLFAYPVDTIDNSDIYKMMKKAPYLKQEALLVKDLEFIKRQFELINHSEGIALVQKELDTFRRR